MLDHVAVFTRGGLVLWAWSGAPLRGAPLDALVRACLLEDRAGGGAGGAGFAYDPRGGGALYTV
jgi:hypothetical protein